MKQTTVFKVQLKATGDKPARVVKIALDYDLDAIALSLGKRAADNTTLRAIGLGGKVVARFIRTVAP